MQLNKKATLLILLLAISMMAMVPVISMKTVAAEPVPKTTDSEVVWASGGAAAEANLTKCPQFLQIWTETSIGSKTTVIVQGTDSNGAPIEARAVIPENTAAERTILLNDTHTTPPEQVAFSSITNVFQENGTDGNQFLIETSPIPHEQYLGTYHTDVGYEPGQCHPSYTDKLNEYNASYTGPNEYLYVKGYDIYPGWQLYPVEPFHPEFLKVLINWADGNNPSSGDYLDLIPQGTPATSTAPATGEYGTAGSPAVLTIIGLDQYGNPLSVNITIHAGDSVDYQTICSNSFSTICTVTGGASGDSYYIFTEPQPVAKILVYTVLIDHMTIRPASYDILANPQVNFTTLAVGNTTITVTLVDADGNIVCSPGDWTIEVNFQTSDGRIHPSTWVWIQDAESSATVNLTAETNAKTLKVVAYAMVSSVLTSTGTVLAPAMNLQSWTEMTFDGISSVGPPVTPGYTTIHTLMWGYKNRDGATYTAPVVPEPNYAITGNTVETTDGDIEALNGPVYEVNIPLFPGCNLISCPVHPMLSTRYNTSDVTSTGWGYESEGIPMSALFGKTSATSEIIAIWWCYDHEWEYYIPGVTAVNSAMPFFTDGFGYWVYTNESCSLEISGVSMDSAQFSPTGYTLYPGWNLVGYTETVNGMPISTYFESVNTGPTSIGSVASAVGPLWTYYAYNGQWYRDPPWGLYPGYGFWVYNKLTTDLYLAP
jgi:hypothetical protein